MALVGTISTVNSLLRTIIAGGVLAVVTVAGWFGYEKLNSSQQLVEVQHELEQVSTELKQKVAQIETLNKDLVASKEKISQLKTAMHLLKVDHRVAQLRVLDQKRDGAPDENYTVVEFVEVDEKGNALEKPQRFLLKGTIVYIDYWVVTFMDEYVENADLSRSTSLCLFRRIFGEQQRPVDAYTLDEVGTAPKAYARGREITPFEQQIWDDFWTFANDPARAKEIGIRAAHGQANYTELRPGMTYRLEIRASGGMTIQPIKP